MKTNAHRTIGQIAIARFALLTLASHLLLFTLPAVAQAQFTYTTNNGGIIITGYTGPGGDVTIPDTINGLPVTSLGDYAFYFADGVTSVTIPNSVASIGMFAFAQCVSLTTISLPNGLTSIPSYAFQDCSGLTNIAIPGSVTSIGSHVFDGCSSLTEFTGGAGITNIGPEAFWGSGLNNVVIPSSVTSIGAGAFVCDSLATISVDPANSFFRSVAGVLFDKSQTSLIHYPAAKNGSDYTVPDGVTLIAASAFNPSALTNITIPNSVQSIEPEAFSHCRNLSAITLPNSLTNLGGGAFSDCVNLRSLIVGSGVTSIGDYAFFNSYNLTGVFFRGDAPSLDGLHVFESAPPTIYYLPGTTGWGATFGGRPTALWSLPNPVILTLAPYFGLRTNAFGFRISWATNVPVVVEACTNLAAPVWSPVATNTLTDGWSYFSDPQWTNYPSRIYRVRSH